MSNVLFIAGIALIIIGLIVYAIICTRRENAKQKFDWYKECAEGKGFCIECRRHCYRNSILHCMRRVLSQDLVSGVKTYPTCQQERDNILECGEDARFWEFRQKKFFKD